MPAVRGAWTVFGDERMREALGGNVEPLRDFFALREQKNGDRFRCPQ